jgi:hypothetical protein
MRSTRARFTIRWIMETTAIVALALWSLRWSLETWLLLPFLILVYVCGLAPLRRLHGFAPISRFFGRWAGGHLPVSQEGGTRDDGGVWQG